MVVSAVARSVSASYMQSPETTFLPDVSIMVPAFDESDENSRDFSGTTFAVSFTPAAGSVAGCTTGAGEVWEVDSNGDVIRQDESSPATQLVDRPQGRTSSCEYAVELPVVVTLAEGFLVSTSGGFATTSAAAASAAATYMFSLDSLFAPEIVISATALDSGSAGAAITVAFTPVADSADGCTTEASENWWIGSDGSVARQGEAVSLVNRLQGNGQQLPV